MNRFRPALIAVLIVFAAVACGKTEDKKAATQIAAKVNKQEISVHQINNMLGRAGSVAPEQATQASQQILDQLIDQEVLVQQAQEKKLDRDPRVMQAIEASRREVLSRAYLDQVAAGAGKPTEQDIKDYYEKHPELFKERRLYNLRELAINAKPDFVPALQAEMAKVKALDEIVAWLKSQNIQFAANAGVKSAEQIPLEILPKFHQLKDGQTAIIPIQGGILVVQLLASQSQPTDETQAAPLIEKFLTNQKRADIAAAELKKLRDAAKIEYMGEFAKASDEKGKSIMEAVGGAPAQATVAPQPTLPAPADKSHVDKGVAGLK